MSEIYETPGDGCVDTDGRTDVVFDGVDLDGEFDSATRGTGEALADANPYGFPGGGDVPSTS